ncbi:actin cortical patch SUR7/pH-response regulator pali [Flammula alnicola]|nr:actin cortical patch SUR7/pH-response regulator pali [Flammula alnicola]
MRGEVCISFASILSFTSLLLLIFVHVGQINTSTIPRKIFMVKVNMSAYGDAVQAAIFNPVFDLYTNNASAPLNAQQGLRQFYEFGLYSYCAYVDEKAGICGNHTAGQEFKPYDIVTSDMISNFSILSATPLIPLDLTFKDSKYLGQTSKAAYWMILLGTICAALALVTGIAKNNLTFFVSSIFSAVGCIFLLIAASLWTVLIRKTEAINTALQAGNQQSVGISISEGSGLFLTWAAFVCLFVSVIPYAIMCCTYRG